MAEFPWQIEPSYEGLLSLIEEMNCGVLIRDLEGNTLYANKRLLEWSGYEAKRVRFADPTGKGDGFDANGFDFRTR